MTITVTNEIFVRASPADVFASFGSGPWAGWFFGAEVDRVRPGAPVRLRIPMGGYGHTAYIEGTARVSRVVPGHQITLEQETPWRGRVSLLFNAQDGGTRVRLAAEVDDSGLEWLGRALGTELDLSDDDGTPAVRIGLLTCYTGNLGVYGRAIDNCARLAIEEINADGGIKGLPVRLVTGDDGCDPATGLREARRLHEGHGVDVLFGSHISSTFHAVRPYIAPTGLPYVFIQGNREILPKGRTFVWGDVYEDHFAYAVPVLMRDSSARNWFVIGNDYRGRKAVNGDARRAIHRSGGRVVRQRYVRMGRRDYSDVLEAIEHSGADLVASLLVGGDAVAFERQCHSAGLRERVRTLAAVGLDEISREHIGNEAATGLWATLSHCLELPTPENEAFMRRYRETFGPFTPPPAGSAQSIYDAIGLYAAAARRAPTLAPGDVVRALPGSSYNGPRGLVRVGPDGRLRNTVYLAEAMPGGTLRLRGEYHSPTAHR